MFRSRFMRNDAAEEPGSFDEKRSTKTASALHASIEVTPTDASLKNALLEVKKLAKIEVVDANLSPATLKESVPTRGATAEELLREIARPRGWDFGILPDGRIQFYETKAPTAKADPKALMKTVRFSAAGWPGWL